MNPEFFMQRSIELAGRGAGYVAPNPMVGAVLMYKDRIIGEGWHQRYGEAHAEVNCIASVKEVNKDLVAQSTMYVTLEPCAHFGKTPPCADLIIANKIPKVVIGCLDPFARVDGKGVKKLKAGGVEVVLNVLEKECRELNRRFFTFHTLERPYIILKWAQTADGKIASGNKERLQISNDYSNRLVHRWRSEEPAILIGTNTALADDPQLTTRLWEGPSPARLVVDMNLKLPSSLKIFNGEARTIVFNKLKQQEAGNLLYYRLTDGANFIQQLAEALHRLEIQSVLVEGGARLLQSFINEGTWDEIRKIENRKLRIGDGLDAPVYPNAFKTGEFDLLDDKIELFRQTP